MARVRPSLVLVFQCCSALVFWQSSTYLPNKTLGRWGFECITLTLDALNLLFIVQRQVSTFAKLVGQSFEVQCECNILCVCVFF